MEQLLMLALLGTAVGWLILLSPVASAAIVIRSLQTGRRVKGELIFAIVVALFGFVIWMFLATAYALQSGHSWVVWLPLAFAAAIISCSAKMAKLSLIEWAIILGVLYTLNNAPYESKVKPVAKVQQDEQR